MENHLNTKNSKEVYQLRIYELFEKNETEFYERMREYVVRIMKKYEFNILGTWKSKFNGRIEFVYLLKWPDEKTMTAQWKKFMADQEWNQIKDQTTIKYGNMVGDIENRVLSVAYPGH
ncbi:NIPSNAP family protein [Sinomicrobium weinanense]|uniref:NIPSNAP family protein n=1 Tax=Sinomicrobium weinanense TaxID=2842200 RepID=A0A926JPF3_9FLAO|nr:NIPSNAP family protein [Sinomicrobium weinanense]MBC9794862.1 NIPSNAP family protein [Sinomicrobium weinanense]MBU3125633.1 NIPSNAP family protein [Sinomicrobium weinanense]